MRRVAVICTVSLIALMAITGCGKKKTKIDPMPEQEPVQQTVAPEPTPTPVQEEVFTPVDMDAEIRAMLQTVYFDYDKYTLRADAKTQLEKIAPYLAQKTSIRILIQGHADERGTDDYNMGLGESRAKVVLDYLVNFGIARSRLEMVSYGRTQPIAQLCPDESCHSQNRRVEWQVLSK